MTDIKPDMRVDCLGLYCPEPIYRTRRALDELEKGQVLEVKADDPAAEPDIRNLVNRLGYEIISVEREGDTVTILIRK